MKKNISAILVLVLFLISAVYFGFLIHYNEPVLEIVSKDERISDYDAKYKYNFKELSEKEYFLRIKIEVVKERQGILIKEIDRDTVYLQTMGKHRF